MTKQRIVRLLIFGLGVVVIIWWLNRFKEKNGQLGMTAPDPVAKIAERVEGVTKSEPVEKAVKRVKDMAESEPVQNLKQQVLGRFIKEKEKIVENQISTIIKEIKSLPENQFEEFKGELCSEVCGE